MNASMFSALLTIASAPVVDPCAPLAIRVTAKGRQTLRAHDAPVPRVRRRQPAARPTCEDCGREIDGDHSHMCNDCRTALHMDTPQEMGRR